MALLSDEDRRDVWAAFMADISQREEPIGLTKAQLLELVGQIDAAVDATAAAFYRGAGGAIGAGAMSQEQFDRLFVSVVRRRIGEG